MTATTTATRPTEAQEIAEDTERLKAWLPRGTEILFVLDYASNTSTARRYNVYAMLATGFGGKLHAQYLSGYVASVMGYRRHDNGSIKIGGGDHHGIASNLAYRLWGSSEYTDERGNQRNVYYAHVL